MWTTGISRPLSLPWSAMARKAPAATHWRPETLFDAGPAIDERGKEIWEALRASLPHWSELDEWAMIQAWTDVKLALATYAIDAANLETAPRTATVRAHLSALAAPAAKLIEAIKAMDLRTAELLKVQAGAGAPDPFVAGHRRIVALQEHLGELDQWIGKASANMRRRDPRLPIYPGLDAFTERLAAIWRRSEPAFTGSRKNLSEVKFIRAILKAGGFYVSQPTALKAVQRVVSQKRSSRRLHPKTGK